MIAGLDSSYDAPAAADADAARAAGVGVWSGYLATRAGVGLAAPWTQGAFENARRCGGTPLAFCSGWDDPVAVRDQAQAWRVRPCLDVEPGIRGWGSWVPDWLRASGAGLYGAAEVHAAAAPFHVLANYPCAPPTGCNPAATWPSWLARPAGALGWQWWGTHIERGLQVDRLWLDDWYGGDEMATVDQVFQILSAGAYDGQPDEPWLVKQLKKIDEATLGAIKAELDLIESQLAAGEKLTADQVLARIRTALQAA